MDYVLQKKRKKNIVFPSLKMKHGLQIIYLKYINEPYLDIMKNGRDYLKMNLKSLKDLQEK